MSTPWVFFSVPAEESRLFPRRLVPGTGEITINNRTIDDYFGLETLKVMLRQPFVVTKQRASSMLCSPLRAAASPVRLAQSVTVLLVLFFRLIPKPIVASLRLQAI